MPVSGSAGGGVTSPEEGTQIVTVEGELDLLSADSLYRRGRMAIGRHARLLLLDLAGVSFCDSCGLTAFVRIANEADAAGCRYGLVAPQPIVLKVLRITGLDQRLPIFRSIEEARLRFTAFTGGAAVC
jgi:anti-sigma B factor antagonist